MMIRSFDEMVLSRSGEATPRAVAQALTIRKSSSWKSTLKLQYNILPGGAGRVEKQSAVNAP
jgi:hypothetical protein